MTARRALAADGSPPDRQETCADYDCFFGGPELVDCAGVAPKGGKTIAKMARAEGAIFGIFGTYGTFEQPSEDRTCFPQSSEMIPLSAVSETR